MTSRLMVYSLLGTAWLSGGCLLQTSSPAPCATPDLRAMTSNPVDSRSPRQRKTANTGSDADWAEERLPMETHWYEPANPLGLEVFTRSDLAWISEDALALRYTGPLRKPLAEDLRKLLSDTARPYKRVLLELDSDGGEFHYVQEIVSVLREARSRVHLTTRVMEGSLCASGCIPVFMQGETRKASSASIWVFHGARSAFTNVPDPLATEEYLNLLSSSGMSDAFRAMLESDNRIYRPGSLIISGYQLFSTYGSGIITELLPVWREETPVLPSGLGPR